jgi:hypothetical protein
MEMVGRTVPWKSAGRTIAVLVTLMLGLEFTLPIWGYAQQSSVPVPVTSPNTQDLPPIQEAANVYERKPYYKKWWFWGIVGTVIAGAAAGAAIAIGGGGESTPTGTVTITGPPPR